MFDIGAEATDLISKKPWFEFHKGWFNLGFRPANWRGWLVLLVAVAVIAASQLLFGSDVRLVVTIGAIFAVILIAFFTTESWFL